MANTLHDQLSGPDLHANKIDLTTGTELTAPSQAIYDNRWQAKSSIAGLQNATSTQTGVLSSTDWATFNGKQSNLGYIPVNRAGDTITGILIAAMQDHGGQIFSVRAYGATGDGTTDDTNAIKATITAMASNGGIIFFPVGTYYVTINIALPSNITVIGCGSKSIIKTSATLPGGSTRSPFEIGVDLPRPIINVTIDHLAFNIGSANGAIYAASYSNLTISNCLFTGSGSGNHIVTVQTTTDCKQLKLINNRFADITTMRPIYLRPSGGFNILDSLIQGNHFENTYTSAIQIDDGTGKVRDTRVVDNSFIDLVGGDSYGQWAVAVYGGLNSPYIIQNLLVQNNYFYNSLTTGAAGQGFVWVYQATGIQVLGNIAVATSSVKEGVIFMAPGRVSNPLIGLDIKDNYVEGWRTYWDPDAMTDVEFSGNTIRNCGPYCLMVGYGTQKRMDIHNNRFYNCGGAVIPAFVNIGNSSPQDVKIHDNLWYEDIATPSTQYFVMTTGNGAFDSTGVEVYNNKLHLVNGALTSFANKQFVANILPRVMYGNEVIDTNGISREFPYAQGSVTGATAFNRVNGETITATLTGAITVTLTAGLHKGETLALRLTQDATGSRTATWPSNFKKSGGTLILSTTANATDIIAMRWDSVSWIEVSRALNVS